MCNVHRGAPTLLAFSEVKPLEWCFIEILSIARELEAVLVGSFERGSALEQGRGSGLGD